MKEENLKYKKTILERDQEIEKLKIELKKFREGYQSRVKSSTIEPGKSYRELAQSTSKLETAHQELQKLKEDLEEKVKARTKELQEKVDESAKTKKALMNILEDIEETRERAEEEKNKTVAIITNFIDPIIILDRRNKISMINPSAQKVFGLSSSDLGRVISSSNQFSLENFRKIIKIDYTVKQIKSGEDGNFIGEEVNFKHDNQDNIYKIITAKVKGGQNEFYGTMKIFYDLTREKMIDRLKTEFISIAAHQLRTPLSAIKWVIKMVLDGDAGKLNKEQNDLLTKGYKSNERVINLVNNLLNVSRIEEGRFGYSFANCDFQEILDVVLENVERQVAKNHLKLIINKPNKLPLVYFDKNRIILAFQNLLDNAIKYTPEFGKIELNIENREEILKITIKDSGIGIPERDQIKLFSKFFRAANVIRSETEGTGLGLFIAKNIIDRHGGKIFIESQEGKGTTVDFTLPIHAKTNPTP